MTDPRPKDLDPDPDPGMYAEGIEAGQLAQTIDEDLAWEAIVDDLDENHLLDAERHHTLN